MNRVAVRKPGFRIGSSARVVFSDDGLHLATVGRRVTVWDVAARCRVASVHALPHECEVDFSPDGRLLVVKNTLGDVVVLERESMAERLRLYGKPYGEGSAIRFSPCGKFLVDGSWAGDFLVRDVESGEVVIHEQAGFVRTLDCSRDRTRWLYSTDEFGLVVRFWPFAENDPFPGLRAESRLGLGWGSTLSEDGTLLARATGRAVETWKLDLVRGKAKPEGSCEVPTSGTNYALAWHPTGTMLAYAASGVALLLTADARPVWWGAGFRYACAATFSPDGTLVAIGDWSKGAVMALDQLHRLG